VTDNEPIDELVDGLRRAAIHFSKAAFEVASGLGDLISGVVATVRPPGDEDDGDNDVERIDIE